VVDLVLLRHGESEWNLRRWFTGWADVALTEAGRRQATQAGRLLRAHDIAPDVVHTSVLRRSIETADLVLDEIGRGWAPAHRTWRLNERHYGDLQGRSKADIRAEHGEAQYVTWRRSYAGRPPELSPTAADRTTVDARYTDLLGTIPRAESLRDVTERLLPYWYDAVVPQLRNGLTVLIAAHSNSLRALVKHLDRVSDTDVVAINVPTGVPLLYPLDVRTLRPNRPAAYLDPAAARRGIAAVAAEGSPIGRAAESSPINRNE
jgi:2,3-bisphosphoglycerate-dependent phosphoglycerate mutase